MTVGKRIKGRRQQLGLSVEYIAKALGKDRATVYRYESEYLPRFAQLFTQLNKYL